MYLEMHRNKISVHGKDREKSRPRTAVMLGGNNDDKQPCMGKTCELPPGIHQIVALLAGQSFRTHSALFKLYLTLVYTYLLY